MRASMSAILNIRMRDAQRGGHIDHVLTTGNELAGPSTCPTHPSGDDLFHARDWQALDGVHHPDMVAYVTGAQSRSMDVRHMARR